MLWQAWLRAAVGEARDVRAGRGNYNLAGQGLSVSSPDSLQGFSG